MPNPGRNRRQFVSMYRDQAQQKGYMEKNKQLTSFQLLEKIVTAVNIATGDDGSRAKQVVDNFCLLLKMDDKKYKEQQKYYG